VIGVPGRRAGRLTVAALVCYKPRHTSRLIYRLHLDRRRAGQEASFTETDYIALIDTAHRRLGGPIVLILDSLNRHISHAMRSHVQARPG